MKKLVHVKSLITLALCLMMCFTFFAPASTVQAKKRVVDNVFMYPTDPYSYPTCTGWVPCKKTFTSSKKASKTYVRETAWKVIDTAYLYKAATSRGKVFYDLLEKQNALLAKEKQLMNCRSSLRSVEDKEMLRQYRALKKRLSDTPDWDDRFEIYQEELNTFLKQMPEGMLKAEEERQQINAILQEIRHEKRIVNRIVEEERSLNKEQKISKTERTEIRHRR